MTNKNEALKMAVEAMQFEDKGWECQHGFHNDECPNEHCPEKNWFKAINACKEALEQPAQRNFCERCGKRASKDLNHIHTCTPPQELKENNT